MSRTHALLLALVSAAMLPESSESQWIEPPGEGWVDLTLYHLDTRRAFDFDGDVSRFFADGHAKSTSTFLTLAGGLAPGLDTWVQIPYHRLRYDDARDERLRSGIGDTNLYLRISPLGYAGSEFPFAIRGGVKVPVGDFAVDSEIIPLGDGQRDWELMAEVGHSFFPFPAYLSGWIGYRWREPNEEAERDFGDEGFFLAQVGGNRGALGAQLIVEGLDSVTTPVIEGIPLPNAERSMLQVTPKISYDIGPGTLSGGARIPLTGKNLPAGVSVVLGYFGRWSL